MNIPQPLKDRVTAEIRAALPATIACRHSLHQAPELTWKEDATAASVAASLEKIPGVEVKRGVGKLGVVGTLKGDLPGPVIALRADMDALPVEEKTGATYASKHKGIMHACGHDGHMANLLGSAQVLSKLRSELRGTVKFIFQPAEEGGAGARVMSDDGALDDPKVDMIFGLHGWPELPAGKVFVKDGPMMAAHARVTIKVTGTGCHAAMPHLGTDQVLVAARLVDALQSVSSRIMAPVDPVALTIATIHGGTAINVIPDEVLMTGTLRTVTKESEKKAMDHIQTIAAGIALAHGVKIDVLIEPSYPAVVNHSGPAAFLESVARDVIGTENVLKMAAPTMGAEDFAFYLERRPGAFFFLGVHDGRAGNYPSLHNPRFDFNDASLESGMQVMVHLALASGSYRPNP